MRAGWMNGRLDYYCPVHEVSLSDCDCWCLPQRLELAKLDRLLWKFFRKVRSRKHKFLRWSRETDAIG